MRCTFETTMRCDQMTKETLLNEMKIQNRSLSGCNELFINLWFK